MPIPNNDLSQLSSSDNQYQFTDVLKAINFTDPSKIALKETGEKIAKKMYNDQIGSADNLNFFAARASKWINLLKWATGTQDMTEFLDYFNVSDGNKAYVKIDMTPIMVGPQFVSTLVDSICQDEEYPCVTAIDPDSINLKEQLKKDALYRMHEVDTIHNLQQAAGAHFEQSNAYVPDDELAADVYFQIEHRLPIEEQFEEKMADILEDNQYRRVLKRKIVYDEIVHNIGVTKIERAKDKYIIRKCIPQNVFYNFFVSDTGKCELAYIGEFYNLKVRDIRVKYGMSPTNPKGLTEKEIFELAKQSTTKNTGIGFSYIWKEDYNYYNYNRPWDDYSIYTMDFVIEINESEYYVGKTDSWGKENITPKQSIPKPTSDKATMYKKNKNRWYHGVYAPYAKMMLNWGLSEINIFPYNDYEQGLCPYSINIPNNNGMYVPSLFERAMEPLREYAITKLKRKQLIAKLRPSGIRIDVENARNVDLGNGNKLDWLEVVRIFDQTGNEIWSSRGVNPLEKEQPAISNTANDDAVQKIASLTQLLQEIYLEIRALLGVPQYRDGSQVGDRTPAALAEGQNTSSFNVTDFIPNAANQLLEETLYKLCLLYWQDEVKKGDNKELINTRFKLTVEMKPTLYEQQQLEKDIAIGMQEQLLSFKDRNIIRNIKNFKVANQYLAAVEEKNKREAAQAQQANVEQNAKAQQESNAQTAQNAQELQDAKFEQEKKMKLFESEQTMKADTVNGLWQAIVKGIIPPSVAQPILQQLIPNITIQLAQENKIIGTALAVEQMQQEQQDQQQPQGQQPQQGMLQPQGQPPMQQQPQPMQQ